MDFLFDNYVPIMFIYGFIFGIFISLLITTKVKIYETTIDDNNDEEYIESDGTISDDGSTDYSDNENNFS